MKKFKSFVYVLALALIFVGAASVTKASADDPVTYAITWEKPENCTSVKVTAAEVDITSGSEVAEGVDVYVVCTPADGYEVTVTSDDATVTKSGSSYGFKMPAKAVTLTITATEKKTEPSPSAGTITATPNYALERIEVTSDKQVYYQIVKAADQKSNLKPANWIKAAKQESKYYIDFSATANTKDAFFALTTDNTKGDAAVVVTVDAVIKSVKIGLNYKAETITAENGLADIIASLNVKGLDSKDDKADGKAADYQLKWKRGANGTWANKIAFTQLEWDMLKASNGTLYIAIDGKTKPAEFRLSKEVKVKVPKAAKAPTVKVDFVKGTIALKNGMQVRVNADTKWMDIVTYDKDNAEKNLVFALATANKKTAKKVSSVSVDDFVKAVMDDSILNLDSAVADGTEVTLTVRTAATDKKFPSMEGTLKFKTPATNPAVVASTAITYTKADREKDVEASFIIDFTTIQSAGIAADKYAEYEYILADKAEDKVNFAKQKWTKCPANGKLDLSTKIGKTYTCALEGGGKATVKYEDTSVIYFRKAAVKEDTRNKVAGVFASKMSTAAVTITEAKPVATEYTVTWNDVTGSNVTVKVGDTAVEKGGKIAKDAEVSVTVAEGYTVTAAAGEDSVAITNGKFKMPAANVTLTIAQEQASQPTGKTITWTGVATVTYKVGDNEAVSVTNATTLVPQDAVVTITVGSGATVTGIEVTGSGTTFNFTMPNEAVTFEIVAAE